MDDNASSLSASSDGVAPVGPALPDDLAALRPARLILDETGPVGAALRRARESLDLGVEDIASATHVRAAYVAALERTDLGALPARPFALGYVRAYARALGLDADVVAARFRGDVPAGDEALRTPLGEQFRRRLRFGKTAWAALLVVAALAAWNFIVHLRAEPEHAPAAAPPAAAMQAPPPGPLVVGAPLPPPPEAAAPAPYETPGLAAAIAKIGPQPAADAAARIAAEAAVARAARDVPIGAPLVVHGEAYGAAAGAGVVLQAVAPVSLIARGPDGAIYFGRQLEAGDIWRAPDRPGLVADVDQPDAVEVYVGGKAVGPLTAARTPVASFAAPAAPAMPAAH